MKLTLIVAPYDSGHYRAGCGLGPDAILAAGLVDKLASLAHDVEVKDIGKVGDEQGREIATGFAVCRAVAFLVRAASDEGRFPIVLAGNCLTAAGSIAGEAADSIVWFDQHGDLNTPETSAYGFLDGMALATVLGMSWRPMTAAIPGFEAVEPSKCLLVDARDLDPDEEALLIRLPIIRASCEEAPEQAKRLRTAGARRTHLHLDLDVHDPSVLRVNRYANPGGPSPDELRRIVSGIAKSLPLSGLTLTAYDPAVDKNDEVPLAVRQLLVDFLAALESA
jgi:arginase